MHTYVRYTSVGCFTCDSSSYTDSKSCMFSRVKEISDNLRENITMCTYYIHSVYVIYTLSL